jgi:hypothetical protein
LLAFPPTPLFTEGPTGPGGPLSTPLQANTAKHITNPQNNKRLPTII